MLTKIIILCVAVVAANAVGTLLHGVHPAARTIVSKYYASPVVRHVVAVAPIAKLHAAPLPYHHAAPIAVHHAASHAIHRVAPVALAYRAPISYSISSKMGHIAPIAAAHAAPVVHSTSTVSKYVAPFVRVSHRAGHLGYRHGAIAHRFYGHRYGGVGIKSYNGVKSIHY